MLDRRMTLAQHQEILALAGLLAELVGCVEYDTASYQLAESTRRAALSLGEESGDGEVIGWAHEMRAWFALTMGDYRGVIRAAEAGEAQAPGTRAAVQLAAQRAKAWARIGDRRQVEVALDQGRAHAGSGCRTRTTSTITSWSTRASGTSTRWTATGYSVRPATAAAPRTGWPRRTRTGDHPHRYRP